MRSYAREVSGPVSPRAVRARPGPSRVSPAVRWTVLAALLGIGIGGCGGAAAGAPLRSADRASLERSVSDARSAAAAGDVTVARMALARLRGEVTAMVHSRRLSASDGRVLTLEAERAAARLPASAAPTTSTPSPQATTTVTRTTSQSTTTTTPPPPAKGRGNEHRHGQGHGNGHGQGHGHGHGQGHGNGHGHGGGDG